ncbi:hypothetical protein CU098_005341 [Rhizopus stolonifer]|uniref:L-ascorbate oxidase n=1 Tax=Rhizopus stolonifer TaxID=4846 RepID=A0A367J9L1_RHIST|nr:hypothetical protein CU098_005341 [Rhizopus stolonifer]
MLRYLLILLLFISLVISSPSKTSRSIRKITLHIKPASINPDCFTESFAAVLINDQFPAPAIHVVKGDLIDVTVKNDPSHNASTSIHFHGIKQLYTNYADGVPGVTQLPILPGQEYTQRFKVDDQSGTYFYHAHVSTQDDTIQGPFIIYESEETLEKKACDGPYSYDEEFTLQWSHWWHQSLQDREAYYLGSNFAGDSGPDSVLLNGKGVYPNVTLSQDQNCKGFTYFDVEPNKVYRLRNIGAVTFRMLEISIKDHDMKLIEIDGEYVKPFGLKSIEIDAGQRMSVLIRTGNHKPGSLFPILSQFKWRNDANNPGYTQSGYGYLRYINPKHKAKEALRILSKPKTPPYNATNVPGWVLSQVKPYKSCPSEILDAKPDHTFYINMREVILPDNRTRFINNNRPYMENPWESATTSLLDMVKKDHDVHILEKDGYDPKHHTYPVGQNKIIDLVFQNHFLPSPAPPGLCVSHPWHTHGYSHYLLAEGAGDYDPKSDKDVVTFSEPLFKDVSIVYPRISEGSIGCGWTKVRIFTDNPGVWAIHCHITAHMLQGKIIVLEVAPEKIKSKKSSNSRQTRAS